MADGDYAAATADLQQLLADAPADDTAKAMLGQVTLLARAAEPALMRSPAPTPPRMTSTCSSRRGVRGARPVGAGSGVRRLIAVVRRTGGDERNAARARLVELFGIIGDDDPRVTAARRALVAALF